MWYLMGHGNACMCHGHMCQQLYIDCNVVID